MTKVLNRLLDLMPTSPLQVGEVADTGGGMSTVTLPGGGSVVVRGAATIGSKVFIRAGSIEGQAPDLPIQTAEV